MSYTINVSVIIILLLLLFVKFRPLYQDHDKTQIINKYNSLVVIIDSLSLYTDIHMFFSLMP